MLVLVSVTAAETKLRDIIMFFCFVLLFEHWEFKPVLH